MRETFANATAELVMAAFGVLIALIGLAMLPDAFGVVFVVFGVVTAIRGGRGSRVVVSEAAVETRSIARTRRFPMSEVSGVEVAIGQTGMNGFGREHLVLRLADGSTFAFKELNAKPLRVEQDGETVVRRAASRIGQELQRRA